MTKSERFAHYANSAGALAAATYREASGTRLAGHLRPGDEVRCAVAPGVVEWRQVVDVIRTGGFIAVYIAAAELESGRACVQLAEATPVACRTLDDAIDHRNLRDILARRAA